jgi:phosphomannomutase
LALIKSISGTRGTIGGKAGLNLTPLDIVETTAAFGYYLRTTTGNARIVVGRDGRISGEIVKNLIVNTLLALGMDVIDLDLSTTPTVEIAIPAEKAAGGIIVTASHNPKNWNALKLLNSRGEFISAAEGQQVVSLSENKAVEFATVEKLGHYRRDDTYIQKHIDQILALQLVETEAIRSKGFRVAVDCINSTGATSVIPLLEQLGCEVFAIHDAITGDFAHNPEPLAEHLEDLSRLVVEKHAHLGIAVDPDVDRLVFVSEDGEMFGEEYTLVAVSEYILRNQRGNTVSNLSSTRALQVVTEKMDGKYYAAAVGEVNVVEKMKEVNAVIGGEGNGGIIYPALHYGRDALAGIALFMSYLAKYGKPVSFLRRSYPAFFMSKEKITLDPEIDLDGLFENLKFRYGQHRLTTIDGLKIDLDEGWIHLRRSNTEPIIRIYTEGNSPTTAKHLARKIQQDIGEILKGF